MTHMTDAETGLREAPRRRDLLSIYLNDHNGAAIGGVALAKRTLAENEDNEYTPFFLKFVAALDSDRQALLDVMESLGFRVDPVKAAGGWLVERLGRLKPNGQLTGYSPQSRVLEIETLLAGSRARMNLFWTLKSILGDGPDVANFDLLHRAERAEDHLRELSELGARACREAFAA